MVPKVQEMKGIIASDSSNWTLLVESKSDGVKIETKKSIRQLTLMRASGTIDWPAKDIYRCLSYQPMRKEWDINNDVFEHKKKIGVNAFVSYVKTVKKFVISSRDFVINYLLNEESDGTVIFCTSSDNCVSDIGPVQGIVRAHNVMTGFVLTPVAGDKSKTTMSMVAEVDLKGAIPEFAMRQVMKDQGY